MIQGSNWVALAYDLLLQGPDRIDNLSRKLVDHILSKALRQVCSCLSRQSRRVDSSEPVGLDILQKIAEIAPQGSPFVLKELHWQTAFTGEREQEDPCLPYPQQRPAPESQSALHEVLQHRMGKVWCVSCRENIRIAQLTTDVSAPYPFRREQAKQSTRCIAKASLLDRPVQNRTCQLGQRRVIRLGTTIGIQRPLIRLIQRMALK